MGYLRVQQTETQDLCAFILYWQLLGICIFIEYTMLFEKIKIKSKLNSVRLLKWILGIGSPDFGLHATKKKRKQTTGSKFLLSFWAL